MKTNRLLCTMITAAALACGASAGASPHRLSHEEHSKTHHEAVGRRHAKDKNEVRRHPEQERQRPKDKSERDETRRSWDLGRAAEYAGDLVKGSKTVIRRVFPSRPAGGIPFPGTTARVLRNRGPDGPAAIGGPATPTRSTAAIKGTEMKHGH
jgi:hypothetical protein